MSRFSKWAQNFWTVVYMVLFPTLSGHAVAELARYTTDRYANAFKIKAPQ